MFKWIRRLSVRKRKVARIQAAGVVGRYVDITYMDRNLLSYECCPKCKKTALHRGNYKNSEKQCFNCMNVDCVVIRNG
jgi:hypothetical protein